MINIGADELILWLRKNNFHSNIGNKELGKKIRNIICNDLHGALTDEDQPAFWANDNNDKNINEYLLPKTAAQYQLNENNLNDLYRLLINL